jgi:hypothetical protein
MLKRNLFVPVLAGLFLVATPAARATTVAQNFAGDPLTNGWSVFGDASLFVWDSTNQNLRVTWDSTHTNSYFYHPLGTTVTRQDDFQIEFDLKLDDCISDTEPGKTGPMQVAIGLFNLAGVTSQSFGRSTFGSSPNIAEFNYFPYGYYTFGQEIYPSEPTVVVDFVSSSGYSYTPTAFNIFEFEFPTHQPVHVAIHYTAKNQTLVTVLTTNGAVLHQSPDIVLDGPMSGFTSTDDFQVDAFSVSSYSSYGDPYNSLLAHGTVDNLFVHIPPVQGFTGAFSNDVWQTQFRSRSNWLYTLERTLDFSTWTNVSPTVPGNAANLHLQDTNPPSSRALYRVRAAQP